jgi:protein associated with RNAse G/E
MPDKQIVTVNSRKFDGRIHRSWQAELKTRRDPLLILNGKFENEIDHPHLGMIRRGTISEEFFWLDRWYSIFRFHEPEGAFRNFYCNLNMPPKFENDVLDYIDLDIDILVRENFECEILDVDEFEENSRVYPYSDDLIAKTMETLTELQEMVRLKTFPFSG